MNSKTMSPLPDIKKHSGPITLKQIAEYAGVSVSTVSHIMGSRADLYTESTQKKVTNIAHKLGYRPNAFARAVRSGKFGSISLLLSSNPAHSNISPPLISGIHDALEKNDFHMSLAMLPDNKLINKDFVPRILREWMSDGLIIAYYHAIPKQFKTLLENHNIPSVWVNSVQSEDCINADDLSAGQQATEYLLKLGHKKIAFVDYTVPLPRGENNMEKRYHGYVAAMQSAGLTARHIGGKIHTPRAMRIEKSRKWLSRSDRPTAVICLAASSALPVIDAALINGLSIPEDLSIITFGSEPLTSTGFHITSMQIPFYNMGQKTVNMLLRKLSKPDIIQPPEIIPFIFDQGNTCSKIGEK